MPKTVNMTKSDSHQARDITRPIVNGCLRQPGLAVKISLALKVFD